MDSRNENFNLNNGKKYSNSFKNFNEIPQFYSTFDNFMKNKMKNLIQNENENKSNQYNFSKLMNSLHEYNKKKSNMELNENTYNMKHQKSFKGISLQNFNDTSIKRHNIYIKKQNTSSLLNSKKINENNLNKFKIYEDIEKIILKLIDNVKNCSQFFFNCNDWIKSFEKTEWLNPIIIKVKRKNNDMNEKEKSINLLIISIIFLFLKLNDYNFDEIILNEKIIKDLKEILIMNHKIYLLLCYNLLLEKNYIKNSNENNYLLGQIKLYIQKNMYINDTKMSLDKEIQSNNKIFFSILKTLFLEIKDIFEQNQKYININETIFNLSPSKLIQIFNKLYQEKLQKLKNINNNKNKIPINKDNKIFNYRNKKFIKKNFLVNEKDLYKTSYNNTFFNFIQNSNSMKNFNDIQCQNNSKNHTRNNINNIYNNIEIEKIPENNQKQNQTIINSSSCKYITLNNFYQNNKNKSQLNINTNLNEENKIKKINKVELLNRMNNNIPKPPFLTTNILYSKFNKKNFTLILDLDETLIKYQICNTNNTSSQNAQNGKILYRPGLIQFLNKIFPLFDIIIWTVATKDYADKIIDNIEKDKKYFSKRLYREHTTYKNKIYIKDLSNLGRALDKVIIVDDKENNFCLQRSNGILIAPFHGTQWECQNDYILMDLYNILTKIVFDRSKDVRIGINKYKKDILEKITKINKCDSDSENKSKNE